MWAHSAPEIGKIIVTARRQRHMTQWHLAAALGVSQKWVSSIESGKENAQLGKVLRVLSYLGVRLRVGEAPWMDLPQEPVKSTNRRRISLAEVLAAHSSAHTQPGTRLNKQSQKQSSKRKATKRTRTAK